MVNRVSNVGSDDCSNFLDLLIEDIMLECSLGWQESRHKGRSDSRHENHIPTRHWQDLNKTEFCH